MNMYKITGILTRWLSSQLKTIGFKNIETCTVSNKEALILMKDGTVYSLKFKKT